MPSRIPSLPFVLASCVLSACETGPEPGPCGDADLDVVAEGIERAGDQERYQVTISSAVPAEPQKGLNTWTVLVEDPAGAPQDDVTVELYPTMPDHGHGTSPARWPCTPGTTAGTCDVSDFNLTMPGRWALVLELSAGAAGDDSASFLFCIEG